MRGRANKFIPEELAWIEANKTLPRDTLTEIRKLTGSE